MREKLALPRQSAVGRQAIRQVNQIALNFRVAGTRAAAEATARHIRRFWAPQLRAALRHEALARRELLSPIAMDALTLLDSDETAPARPVVSGSPAGTRAPKDDRRSDREGG